MLSRLIFPGVFMALVCALLVFMPPALAKDVVFILDASQSMQDTDKDRAAPGAIRAMSAALDDSDKVGVVVFSTDSYVLRPLSSVKDAGLPDFSPVVYEGYTNTGAAMEQALSMLTENEDKAIVILTDGEIMLPTPEETLHSSQLFAADMEKARSLNIPVYVLTIRDGPSDADYKLYSGYAKGETVPDASLIFRARELAREYLGAKSLEVEPQAERDAARRITGLSLDLPFSQLDGAKFIFTADKSGLVTTKDKLPGRPEQVREIYVEKPEGSHFAFAADYPVETALKVDAVVDVSGQLLTEQKREGFLSDEYLYITPAYMDGTPIFAAPKWEGKTLRFYLDDEAKEAELKNGAVSLELPNKEKVTAHDIDFASYGINFHGENSREVFPEQRVLWPWIIAALGIALIILLYLRRKKEEERPAQPPKIATAPTVKKSLPEPSTEETVPQDNKIFFRGLMVIYMMESPTGEDYSPREYNLFRRARSNTITLAELLAGCDLDLPFPGAENIIIGALQRGIYVVNNSDCTMMKRSSIIIKGSQTNMYYNDSIHITFADEKTALLMTYKSLKPTE